VPFQSRCKAHPPANPPLSVPHGGEFLRLESHTGGNALPAGNTHVPRAADATDALGSGVVARLHHQRLNF